ncbi:MAG: DUF2786 domain-containing protein [Bdellovibrionales bacterium]
MNLHQRLVAECLNVIRTHRLNMTPPLIEIVEVESFWGQWSSASSTLKISKKLLSFNRWDWVCGVLRHELAHQFVFQELKSDERGHGDSFQLACERLGVPNKFRKASIDFQNIPLDSNFEQSENSKAKLKIEKLLNLAQSTNLHEAQAALKKAQELNAQFYLDDSKQPQFQYEHVILKSGMKKVSLEDKLILDILNRHFFVFSMIGIGYDLKKQSDHRTLEIWGLPENLLMAEYVFYFLQNQLTLLSQSVHEKKSFKRGLLEGFREQLNLQNKISPQESTLSKALVLFQGDLRLKKYLKQIHPRLSRSSSRASALDTQSYEKGKSIGKGLKISRPLENKKSQFLGFLNSKSSRST